METITTTFVESSVNDVVANRTANMKQIQQPPEVAHTEIQMRTATLIGDLFQYLERYFRHIQSQE